MYSSIDNMLTNRHRPQVPLEIKEISIQQP